MPNIVTQISENVFCITEGTPEQPGGVSAYLVTGTRKAVLIDALRDDRTLYETVKGLSSLPLEVILTHGHWDHAGAGLHEFHEAGIAIYLSEKDFVFFTDETYSHACHGLKADYFTPLAQGQVFDLGGICLETVMLEGHTPGSCVFLEPDKQLLFTGDSTGAGVFWMQLPMCLPLRELRINLLRLWDRVKDMNTLMIHPGHRNQSPIQLYLSFLADTILVTNKIIDGEWIGRDAQMTISSGQHIRCKSVSYNLIRDYCYNPENI